MINLTALGRELTNGLRLTRAKMSAPGPKRPSFTALAMPHLGQHQTSGSSGQPGLSQPGPTLDTPWPASRAEKQTRAVVCRTGTRETQSPMRYRAVLGAEMLAALVRR